MEKKVEAKPKECGDAFWDYATTLSGMMCYYSDKLGESPKSPTVALGGETPKSLTLLVEALLHSELVSDEKERELSYVIVMPIPDWEDMSRQQARNLHIALHGIMEESFKADLFPKPEKVSPYPNELLDYDEDPCDKRIFSDTRMIKATFKLVDNLYSHQEVSLGDDYVIKNIVGGCLGEINRETEEELYHKSGNELQAYINEIKAIELEKVANTEKRLTMRNIESGHFDHAYTYHNGTDKEFMLEVVKIHGADMGKLTDAAKAVADKSPEGRMDFGYGMKLLDAVKKSPEYNQCAENAPMREAKQASR